MNLSKDQDPFEEFEFRPLTEGLGFHNRTTPKEPTLTPSANPAPASSSFKMDSAMEGVPSLRPPLPRKENKLPSPPKVEQVLRSMEKPLDFKEAAKEAAIATEEETATANYDISAIILDGMLLTAGFLTCLIVLLMVTRIDLVGSLTSNNVLAGSLAGLFLIMTWIYLALSRVFMGATPGEWVFDQRMGSPEQFGTLRYTGFILIRATAIIASGLVIFPLISLIFGHDVLGRSLGLELHKA